MKIGIYIRQHWEWIAAATGMITVTNLVLLSSIPLKDALGDILYLNLILLLIIAVGFFSHYRRLFRASKRINRALDDHIDHSSIDYSPLPGAEIMKKMSDLKTKELSEIKDNYNRRLEELNDYLTQTVHDIKINLSVCEMAAGRLENQKEIHNKLIYQIEQIKFRINQVLSISRASCFEEDIKAEPVDIRQTVKDAVTDNTEFFIAGDISIDADLSPYSFIGDRKWIRYIISQILNNSSKYTPENGSLNISGREDKSAYRLVIRDNGIGIPAEEVSRIFDKGFTGTNGRTGIHSTGMGLYYAKRMADILGIGLDVDSKRNYYTEFTISFYKLSDYIRVQV